MQLGKRRNINVDVVILKSRRGSRFGVFVEDPIVLAELVSELGHRPCDSRSFEFTLFNLSLANSKKS